MVRLLLDYGADAEFRIRLGPIDKVFTAQRTISIVRKYKSSATARADAIEKMLLQIPAIRRNSFSWPAESELASEMKYEMKSDMIGEEFSKFLVAMRGRASRKPLVFVHVNEPEM